MQLNDIVDLDKYPLNDLAFQSHCKNLIDQNGTLVLTGFIKQETVKRIQEEGSDNQEKAYFCAQRHNVYLTTTDPEYSDDHVRNREVISSKGCITDDQIPSSSALHAIYDSDVFRNFLCQTLGEKALYDYADNLSSINLHYADEGRELGWHFDNSSFAATLMIQEPEAGGVFEYVKNVRDADNGEMNFDAVEKVLDGKTQVETLSMPAGTLVLFRGRNAMHRVTPTIGGTTRMLVVFAYNSEPGVAISTSASMTFYGRVG